MRKIRTLSLIVCVLLTLALVACDQGTDPEQTTPEITTEAPTEAPTTEQPTTEEPTTEAPTTEQATEPSDALLGRNDFADDDPNNPYLNLIAVGMSYDGMTTCYDGRYDFGYTICRVGDEEFSCMQDAVDYLEGDGGTISMTEDVDICLRLHIPDDGSFYRIYYNWKNCDFVFNYGVVYDDQAPVSEIIGYAYYSDLYELDYIDGLDDTYVWVFTEHEGLAPGRYLMTASDDPQSDFYYDYQKVEEIFEWPGLPFAEYLPE